MKTLGLIAGGGSFPRLIAESASREGFRVVAFGLKGAMDQDLSGAVDAIHTAEPHEFNNLLALMKEEGVTDAVMAGGVSKAKVTQSGKADDLARKAIQPLTARGDDSILRAVAGILEKSGITVRSAVFCAPDLVATEGVYTDAQPTERHLKDMDLGWRVAKEIGKLDIGQTVVVKARSVIAVEAMEGTDATIRRAGELVGDGCVVVKVSKPQQDLRFDMPAVGPGTIDTLVEAGAAALAIEAGRTIVLDRDAVLRRANAHALVLVAR